MKQTKRSKKLLSLLLALVTALGLAGPAAAVDRGERTVEAGKTITLQHKGSYPWTWTVDDGDIVSITPSGQRGSNTYGSSCTLTGLRPGTTTVRLHYSELVWEAGRDPDWFGLLL